MPAYEIWLEKAAERDLKRLDDRLFSQVIRRIRELGINPRPAGAKKLIGQGNDWRIRAGDHRVLSLRGAKRRGNLNLRSPRPLAGPRDDNSRLTGVRHEFAGNKIWETLEK